MPLLAHYTGMLRRSIQSRRPLVPMRYISRGRRHCISAHVSHARRTAQYARAQLGGALAHPLRAAAVAATGTPQSTLHTNHSTWLWMGLLITCVPLLRAAVAYALSNAHQCGDRCGRSAALPLPTHLRSLCRFHLAHVEVHCWRRCLLDA
jgi:hypothetical protein